MTIPASVPATYSSPRALTADADTTRMSREVWRQRNEAAGVGRF